MGAGLSIAVVLRAVMLTKRTAIEAATATPKILRWVFRSAAKIVELFMTAAFQGALAIAFYVPLCSVVISCRQWAVGFKFV
jgi:hypothetical protein